MIAEIIFLSIVPALTAVALVDSFTNLSVSISKKFDMNSGIYIHALVILLFIVLFLVCFYKYFGFSDIFTIVDYVRPQDHYFETEIESKLIYVDMFVVVLAIVSAVFVSIRNRRNIVLGIALSILGNVGSIVWLIRERNTVAQS